MKKALLVMGICLIILIVLISVSIFTRYRLPVGKVIIIEREVIYKMVDLDLNNPRLYIEEFLLGKKSLFVIEGEKLIRFYISKKDYEKCWEENPHEMSKKGYTKLIKIRYRKLLFGDNAPAKIIEIRTIEKQPYMVK